MTFTLVYGENLHDFPGLADQMYRDRGVQFMDALGWQLQRDAKGRELDVYDNHNPLYLIKSDEEGRHIASTRLMPTTGPNMAADHFAHLTDGVPISSPTIWETTRFFVADKANRRAAPGLMWAGCSLALRSGVEFFVGVTGAHMVRVFTACGWAPEVLGTSSSKEGDICACLWEVTEEKCDELRRRAGLPEDAAAPQIYRPRKAPAGRKGVVTALKALTSPTPTPAYAA